MKATVTLRNESQTEIKNIKSIEYPVQGSNKIVIDFTEFSLYEADGDVKFIGDSIFVVRPQDILSVNFTK
ncbi:hypothetical protein R4B61_06650 [Fructilactobacillus vespulae]|uniref:hypothetical protein n=1 Tax=Fructilactobacillus vespulae TaxID=1249630 RepID=UPI0039B4B5DD